MQILAAQSSSALTMSGIVPDLTFFEKSGSTIGKIFSGILAKGVDLAKSLAGGFKDFLKEAKEKGPLNALWTRIKNNPGKSIAVAAGLVLGVVAVVWIGGAALALVGSGVAAAYAALGLGGTLAVAGLFSAAVPWLLNTAERIYSLDWNMTDKAILESIHNSVNALYGPAGEFLGRSMAVLIAGGTNVPPRIAINVRRLATYGLFHPEEINDLQSEVSSFAHMGLMTFGRIALRFALMKGRQGIRAVHDRLPKDLKSLIPFGDQIKDWGTEEREPWSFESEVEERVEAIDDARLEAAVENFLEGFWDQYRESIEYRYT